MRTKNLSNVQKSFVHEKPPEAVNQIVVNTNENTHHIHVKRIFAPDSPPVRFSLRPVSGVSNDWNVAQACGCISAESGDSSAD